jgi:hypothetical protein
MYILFLGFSQTQVSNNLTPILTALIAGIVTYNLYCMNRQDKAIDRLETKFDGMQRDLSEIKGFLMGYGKPKPEPISDTEKETQKTA